jgi:hypothetical protein
MPCTPRRWANRPMVATTPMVSSATSAPSPDHWNLLTWALQSLCSQHGSGGTKQGFTHETVTVPDPMSADPLSATQAASSRSLRNQARPPGEPLSSTRRVAHRDRSSSTRRTDSCASCCRRLARRRTLLPRQRRKDCPAPVSLERRTRLRSLEPSGRLRSRLHLASPCPRAGGPHSSSGHACKWVIVSTTCDASHIHRVPASNQGGADILPAALRHGLRSSRCKWPR